MRVFILILLLFLQQNCTLNKKILNHGVNNLEIKQSKLIINVTNKNDIISSIGYPSTISSFDNDIYIYLEQKTTSSKLTKLGKKTLLVNNVLILEIDNKGLLISKKFYNKNDMKNIKFEKKITSENTSKQSFINDFLKTIIKKIDDPIGKKRSKINQQ